MTQNIENDLKENGTMHLRLKNLGSFVEDTIDGKTVYRKLEDVPDAKFYQPLYTYALPPEQGAPAPLRIVAAANKYIYTRSNELHNGQFELVDCEVIICGHRHFDEVMCSQLDMIKKGGLNLDRSTHIQGFIDNRGKFHDRKESLFIAGIAGQINQARLKSPPADELFSEDLY